LREEKASEKRKTTLRGRTQDPRSRRLSTTAPDVAADDEAGGFQRSLARGATASVVRRFVPRGFGNLGVSYSSDFGWQYNTSNDTQVENAVFPVRRKKLQPELVTLSPSDGYRIGTMSHRNVLQGRSVAPPSPLRTTHDPQDWKSCWKYYSYR
jgi:hypothetical protein